MSSVEPVPIRKQYLDLKRQYPHAILFFRLGDFYETFDADAELVARELDIVLTARNYRDSAVPMAGVPHHAVEGYMAKLIAKGYHVAICEQIGSEPIKGLVPREVTRVVTPGTVVEPGMLTEGRNNYLAAVILDHTRAGFAYVDITTGQFTAAQFESNEIIGLVRHELARLAPAELLIPEGLPDFQTPNASLIPTSLAPYKFELTAARQRLLDHFGVATLAGFGLENQPLAIRCAGAILQYLKDNRPNALNLLVGVGTYSTDEFMLLDTATRRNLELTETMRGGGVRGSLLGVLDKTITPMGARLLRTWVNQPLLNPGEINGRLDLVEVLFHEGLRRAEVRAGLKGLGDLERLVNRVLGGTATPRDLGSIRRALKALPPLKQVLAQGNDDASPLAHLNRQLDPADDVLNLLCSALVDDAEDPLPGNLDHSGMIRAGWSAELDGIVAASKDARDWIANLEKIERERTGIKSLKVSFNKVFGYYIEMGRVASQNAPADYIRKQTLVNAERFITPDLKEYETLVLDAEERQLEVEVRLFKEVCAQIAVQSSRLLNTARTLARLDALTALAEVATQNAYVRPQLTADSRLEIHDGRHPVVEHYLASGERYVPNDILFEPGECVRVITGPNMSGKSTSLRQAALIVLLAQIGSFVPAESATLGMVDDLTVLGTASRNSPRRTVHLYGRNGSRRPTSSITPPPQAFLVLDEIGAVPVPTTDCR